MELTAPKFAGLTETDALVKRKQFGANELPAAMPKSVWRIILDVLREPMLILLVSCGILYILLGDLGEGMMLMASVLIVIAISFFQERKSERALDELRDLSSPRALVIRDGTEKRIAGKDVVPGDIIVLREGDRVPADATLLSGINLQADESLLTGESVERNSAVKWVAGGALGFLLLVLFIPPVRDVFHFDKLHADDLLICSGAGLLATAWFEIIKIIRRKNHLPEH